VGGEGIGGGSSGGDGVGEDASSLEKIGGR